MDPLGLGPSAEHGHVLPLALSFPTPVNVAVARMHVLVESLEGQKPAHDARSQREYLAIPCW